MDSKENILNSEQAINLFIALYERWLDECQYEDINEYLKKIQQLEPRAFAITKRPFGIKVRIENQVHYLTAKLKGKDIQITEYVKE